MSFIFREVSFIFWEVSFISDELKLSFVQ